MPQIQQTKATTAIRVVAGMTGLFAVVYMSWFMYAIYVLEPNEANYSPSGLAMVSLIVTVGVVTVLYARSVWRRSFGVHDRAWKLRAFGVFMIVLPVLVSPLSPTMLVFVIFSLALMFMNSLFTRVYWSSSAE
jgi:hypothetical protein